MKQWLKDKIYNALYIVNDNTPDINLLDFTRKNFKLGAEAAYKELESYMEWRDVNEEMPGVDELVVAKFPSYHTLVLCYMGVSNAWFTADGNPIIDKWPDSWKRIYLE